MANDKKQVTLTFGGYDNNSDDSTLMFEGPLRVASVLNTLDDIYTFNVMPYADSELPLVVFVKNVNDPDRVSRGEVPYRGSFYMYNWDTSAWQQVVLGNHSHKNMEILDQLGEVDTSSMEIGERKVLTIEKIDPDNDGNIRTYEYKISFDTLRELPEVPEYGNGKNLYLSTDSEGKFQWTNSFTPAQTFKMLKITVDNTFIDGSASKTLKLSSNYVNANSVSYNPDMGDEMLVFDTGDLLSDISVTQANSGIQITITNTKPTELFELDEKIVILIIRSGIAGLIDTIEKQYMTKAEAIELLSYGTLNLNQYITKYDLQKYAAQKQHAHSEYIRKDEYDIFDYRYADYQHTHSQYITKAQVLSILLDSVTDSGDINIEGTIQEMVTYLENQLNETLSDIYTREQIDSLVEAQVSSVKNTDAILTTINGMTLTDYLLYLANKEPDISHVDAQAVELNVMKVNIGDADGIGGYKNGTVIEKGTNINEFVKTLITKDVPPKLVEPSLYVSTSIDTNDAGSTAALSLIAIFTQNDAGNLAELSYKIYKSESEKDEAESFVINNNEIVTIPVTLNAINNNGLCYTIEVTASYIDGQEKFSNADKQKAYKISAGTVSKTVYVYNKRLIYAGGMTRSVSMNDPILVDDLYTAVYTTQNSLFTKYDPEGVFGNIEVKLDANKGIKSLVLAIPVKQYGKLKHIMFVNQNYDIFPDMYVQYLQLKDASGAPSTAIDNGYAVLSYSFEKEVQSGMLFRLEF